MAMIPNLVPLMDSGSVADKKYLFGKMDTFVCSIFFLYVLSTHGLRGC